MLQQNSRRVLVRAVSVALWVGVSAAFAQGNVSAKNAEVFVDKGDTFARAGTAQGLKQGTSVTVLGPTIGDTQERRRVGKATVLEVWESLARISLDADAQKESGPKFVELAAPKGVSPTPTPLKPIADASPSGPPLKGRVEATGPRIIVYNDSNITWTHCDVRLPSNKRFVLKSLAPNESEGIMPFRFVQDGVPRDVPTDWVNVKCAEGERRFNMR
ncbi:MAG: hypothetical protein ACT4TC_05305 [Myxococcaceae bacterium]